MPPGLVGLFLVFFLISGTHYSDVPALCSRNTLVHSDDRGQCVFVDSSDNIRLYPFGLVVAGRFM